TPRVLALMERLKGMGFCVMFLSNNNEERVARFNREIGAGYICKAGKPSPANYIRAMERMGTSPETTVFIGDQLFTDIWGAKRAGIRAYLVKPLAKREEIQIVLKRKLERVVLFFYRRALRKAGGGG
ncbi:MAG: HAD-IIIA family hydrolase, partial [Lachnospiraceae bacterium]|nr:HAD-IIIA family hydrolase [Lachnospiraceae bacterium]